MSGRASPGRDVATRVLHRVVSEQAWAAPTLDAEIVARRAAPRDAALATEIVYGTLRVLPSIDRAIEARLKRRSALEPYVGAALRAAAYQLLHLSGAPSHAVVSDAVALVRAHRGEGLARFTNAVLRAIARERPAEPARPKQLEVPRWSRDEIERGLGPERARDFLDARALPPPIALRVSPRITPAELAERIARAHPDGIARTTSLSPLGVEVSRVGDPRALPGWSEGLFAVQDEGSQLVGLLLDAQEGERIADACSGRGGKTGLIAQRVGPLGTVHAIDLHESKLERIGPELERLGLDASRLETTAIDLAVGAGGLGGRFDRVLLDAPCTGIGTLHRRPELMLRLAPGDPARMADLQLAIARNAIEMVRPGGLFVFAVCSPTRAEGPELVARLLAAAPNLTLLPDRVPSVPLAPDDDGVFRIGPFGALAASGPDAYQVARFRVR